MSAAFEEALKKGNISYRKNVLTAGLSTFRIGGRCPFVVEPACIGELCQALLLCRRAGLSYRVIGRASNILFDDAHLPHVLIRMLRLDGLRIGGDGVVIADCGVMLPHLARRAADCGFADLCFAVGIPGTVGGGIYMNAGAHGSCLGELVDRATVFLIDRNEITTYFNNELNFSYRKSEIQRNNAIVLQVAFHLTDKVAPHVAQERIKGLLARRAAMQPLHLPSAGSAFLRPATGEPMGRILDELGLKGLRCGNAAVSEKHAGFIVNLGGATAADVLALVALIQKIVQKERGFCPQSEICYVRQE